MRGGALWIGLAVLSCNAGTPAQSAGVPGQGQGWELGHGEQRLVPDGDFTYLVVDGADIKSGELRIRADRAVLVFDTDELLGAEKRITRGGDLPRRGPLPPISQRDLLASRLRARVEARSRALASTAGRPLRIPPGKERLALFVRAVLAEGNVFFEQRGIRNLRCRKLWLSLVSDRGVMEDVELRLPLGTPSAPSNTAFVLRCPRVVQQGDRLIARDARMSSCDAGEPHFELTSKRLTVMFHGDVTEFLGQGNALRVAGLPALPLPDYRHYSDQENWIPIKGFSAGVSDDLGEFATVTFGGRWNDVGQALADLFATGQRFRGEWTLRTGYWRKRGVPVEGGATWRIPGVLGGRADAMFLRDEGRDRRSVQATLDGSMIDAEHRVFARTAQRIEVRDDTRIDVEGFWSGDPAAYAEFRDGQLKTDEQPETSLHVRHASENRRLSLIGRFNLVDFSYTELATLADSFRSERPYLRADLFSQPLADVAEDMPLVLSAAVGAGRLRNQFDDHSPLARREASWRGDLEVELAVPYLVGPFAVRPFFVARETYYSDRPTGGESAGRDAVEAGAAVATRFLRGFDVASEALDVHGLWHEVRPEVRGFHRFAVSRDDADYFQFDEVDGLTEMSAVDVILLNRLQTRRKSSAGGSVFDDLVWLDLAQRFFPNSARDNAGDRLGLFAWELIVTPGSGWLPVPNLRLLFEGERDWNRNEFKTRNVGLAGGPSGGLTVAAEWRSGADGDGQGSLLGSLPLFQRWTAHGGLIYDFELDELRSTLVSLERRDHDWTWVVTFTRDENTNDTSVSLGFVPTLGGLLRPYRPRYIGGDPAFGVRNAGNF